MKSGSGRGNRSGREVACQRRWAGVCVRELWDLEREIIAGKRHCERENGERKTN